MTKRAGRSRTRLLALEPRVMFDGALADATAAGVKPVDSHAAEALHLSRFAPRAAVEAPAEPRALAAAAAEAPAAPVRRSEIIFLGNRITNFQQLLEPVEAPGARVALLDADREAIDLAAQLGGSPLQHLQHLQHLAGLLIKPRKHAERAGEALPLRQRRGPRRAFEHDQPAINRARIFNGFA